MKFKLKIIPILLVGLLGYLGWPPHQLAPLLFFLFVPILVVEHQMESKGLTGWFFLNTYLALLLFNLSTTWWVWNASPGGAVFMLLANSLLMTFPLMGYRITKQVVGLNRALMMLPLYWLTYEYLHHRWDLAYPWLSLGNSFATTTGLIQWYEYTGILGGTLWVLIVNVLVFKLTAVYDRRILISTVSMVIIPLIVSQALLRREIPSQTSVGITVVQPNIDPYNDKFNDDKKIDHVRSFLRLADSVLTDDSKLVVLPETAIVEYLDEASINQFQSTRLLIDFCTSHPGVRILTGASTYRFYPEGDEGSVTARLHEPSGRYYDSYNTSLLIDSNGVQDVYHKSKLVPGVERMPYPGIFKILGPLAIDMGGISGSLGADSAANTFPILHTDSMAFEAAPLICYESIFGSFTGDFVRKNAAIIFVVTNDGWWGNTPGYRQHMHYARLRAIEFRRNVIRSANTGISCSIDIFGNIHHATDWWEATAFNTNSGLYLKRTFYAQNGDYLGRISSFITLFFGLSVMVKKRTKKA